MTRRGASIDASREIGIPSVTPVKAAHDALATIGSSPAVRTAIVALVLLVVLFARRFAQMLDPQVWDEEGIIIHQAVQHGPLSIFFPLDGYLTVLPRLISCIALLFPFADYPRIAVTLTWVAIIGMLLAVSLVPSRLRGGPLIALTALLVPSNPEIFGLPLYTFWLTIPLLYAAYFWETNRRVMWWRVAAIVTAGLSAPAILLAAPLYAVSAIVTRTRDSVAAAIPAVACALIQYFSLQQTAVRPAHFDVSMIATTVGKLFGGYLTWDLLAADNTRWAITLVVGWLTLGFVALVTLLDTRLRSVLIPLLYLWLGSAALTAARIDVNVIDQVDAGPRYFFLTFMVEGWVFVQIALAARVAAVRWIAALALLGALFNCLPVLSRTHVDLGWQDSIAACANLPGSSACQIPIQYDGGASPHWNLLLNADDCRRLRRFGFIGLLFKP